MANLMKMMKLKAWKVVISMSKYTTEVRYICESEAGLKESVGADDVDRVIEQARTKIFSFDYPIFDESYRAVLEKKILKHYYFREIGTETYGLWKVFLNRKLNEIMPYYNQLYKSELIEFNPMYTTDLTRKKDIKNEGTTETTETANGTTTSTNTNTGGSTDTLSNENVNRYSDTPQGGLTDLRQDRYMTNARIVNDSGSATNAHNETNEGQGTSSSHGSSTGEAKNTEDYLERVTGYEGKVSSELLLKYRETFLNIDMMVIDELKELFMMIW